MKSGSFYAKIIDCKGVEAMLVDLKPRLEGLYQRIEEMRVSL